MFKKRHYGAIAKIIAAQRNQTEHPELEPAIDGIMNDLSEMFKQDNPNFKRDKFERACCGAKT